MSHSWEDEPILPVPCGKTAPVLAVRIEAVTLETTRLLLRPLRLTDGPEMTELAHNPAVSGMTGRMPHPYRETDAASFITRQEEERLHGDALHLAVTRQLDGAFLGCIGLTLRGKGCGELGYWLGESYWNQGYATEAARAVIDHGFHFLQLQRITGEARVINEASRHVLEKCGLRYIGSGLSPAPARGGALPVDRFEMEQRHWASLKNWLPAVTRADVEELAEATQA